MTQIQPLPFGLIAAVVTEDSDRSIYVPPPVARGAHAETCGCATCAGLRLKK